MIRLPAAALPSVKRTVKDLSKETSLSKKSDNDDELLNSSWTVQRVLKDLSNGISPSKKQDDDELLNCVWEFGRLCRRMSLP